MKRSGTRRGRGIFLKAGFLIYTAFCLFAIVWLRTEVVHLEYKIGELDKQRADLHADRERVVAQKASFYSMKNVEQIAMNKLGMEQVDREKVFYVSHAMAARPRVASTVHRE